MACMRPLLPGRCPCRRPLRARRARVAVQGPSFCSRCSRRRGSPSLRSQTHSRRCQDPLQAKAGSGLRAEKDRGPRRQGQGYQDCRGQALCPSCTTCRGRKEQDCRPFLRSWQMPCFRNCSEPTVEPAGGTTSWRRCQSRGSWTCFPPAWARQSRSLRLKSGK